MSGISIWQLLTIFILFGSLLIPLMLTLFSKRANGGQKVGWAILVLCTSWIGYAIFLILAPATAPLNQQKN